VTRGPFAVMAFIVSQGEIVEIDAIADPERVRRIAASARRRVVEDEGRARRRGANLASGTSHHMPTSTGGLVRHLHQIKGMATAFANGRTRARLLPLAE
jgi:hypothetical protein